MLEHIEDELFLPEELKAVWPVFTISSSFFEILDQIDDLSVHENSSFFAGVGKHDEKVEDVFATLDDSVDQIRAKFLTSEIEPN